MTEAVARPVRAMPFAVGNGATSRYRLSIAGYAWPDIRQLQEVYLSDWRGTVPLSNRPRSNQLVYSQQPDRSPWKGSNCQLLTELPAPDGSATAVRLIPTGATPRSHYVRQPITVPALSQGAAVSAYVRSDGASRAVLTLSSPTGAVQVEYRFADARFTCVQAPAGVTVAADPLEDGWVRLRCENVPNLSPQARELTVYPSCEGSLAAPWSRINATAIVSDPSPISGVNYDSLIETAVSTNQHHYAYLRHIVRAGHRYRLRLAARERNGSKRYLGLQLQSTDGAVARTNRLAVDLAEGIVVGPMDTPNVSALRIVPSGDGGRLIEMDVTGVADGLLMLALYLHVRPDSDQYPGDGASGLDITAPYLWDLDDATSPVYPYTSTSVVPGGEEHALRLWGAQLEYGPQATGYIPTFATSVTVVDYRLQAPWTITLDQPLPAGARLSWDGIIGHVPSPTLLPPNATALERAGEAADACLMQVPMTHGLLKDPMRCPTAFLPWLAWEMSLDSWDSAWPERIKRQRIASAIPIQRSKGTAGSVRAVIESFGGSVVIREWWQQSPPGPPYTFELHLALSDVPGVESSAKYVEDVIAEVNRTKPVRSHFTFTQALAFERSLGLAGALRPAVYRRLRITQETP